MAGMSHCDVLARTCAGGIAAQSNASARLTLRR